MRWIWFLVIMGWSCGPSAISPPISSAEPAPDPFPYFFAGPSDSLELADTLSPAQRQVLQTGDLLLRQGWGGWSDYIAQVLDERYAVTHCGWLLPDEQGGWTVLHAVSSQAQSGVVVEPLADYLRASRRGTAVLVRPRCSADALQRALAYAQLHALAQTPFDMAFDDHDPSELYCVELVRNALRLATGIDYLPRRCQRPPLDVLRMDNFFDEHRFEVIWNHWDTRPSTTTNELTPCN